ncbi:MAG: nicotinate-nucleotide pyrophosphorylase [Thermoleophilia bacterium]|nr:nicotinate-nucleotide pyrophosphorylase [Thermoleophilia bacterium]
MSAAVTPTAAERAAGHELLERAYREDLGPDGLDLTAVALVDTDFAGAFVARQDGVVCGIELVVEALRLRGVTEVAAQVADGARVAMGAPLLTVAGDAAAVLAAERTALNVLQRLSGTATRTRAFVDAVAGTRAHILDTRKTMPGMRALQRWAVRCGGGHNHRFGLFDEAMLKDNHIAAAGGIAAAVARIRATHPGVRVHVEADTLDQVTAAVDAGADVVLLDNMTNTQLVEAVGIVAGRALTEASGGVRLDTVHGIAATGVDRISVGELTHSAPAFDAALDADTRFMPRPAG